MGRGNHLLSSRGVQPRGKERKRVHKESRSGGGGWDPRQTLIHQELGVLRGSGPVPGSEHPETQDLLWP